MISQTLHKNFIVFILVFIFACSCKSNYSLAQQSGVADTLVFTGCPEKIEIKSGSIVKLKLEAFRGTGYQWLLKEQSALIEELKPDELKYWTPDKIDAMPGQKSFQVLLFRAVKKGEGLIELEYKRTFEAGIENKCQIKFVVK